MFLRSVFSFNMKKKRWTAPGNDDEVVIAGCFWGFVNLRCLCIRFKQRGHDNVSQ